MRQEEVQQGGSSGTLSQSQQRRAEPLGRPFGTLAEYDDEYTPLGDELGRGASGVVKRATRRRDGAGVAVKCIDLRALRVIGGTGFSISRLRREVDVMLGLRHPNIVELYGAYGDADSVRLVMELVEGEELFDAILSRGHFEEGEAKPIFGSLCAAVAYMHARGVIHRDLKPENVLVRQSADGRGVKLVDFGLSKLVASGRGGSAARTMVGTPSYLAPEIEELRTRRQRGGGFHDNTNTAGAAAARGGVGGDDDRHHHHRHQSSNSGPAVVLMDSDESSASFPHGGNSSRLSERSEAEVREEHTRDSSYDSQVDAWSMGVTLYVMLIARFPVYRRDDEGHIAGVELPREATERLSPQAQSLIVRLLHADPRTRCSVAQALKDPWLETTVSACYSPAAVGGALLVDRTATYDDFLDDDDDVVSDDELRDVRDDVNGPTVGGHHELPSSREHHHQEKGTSMPFNGGDPAGNNNNKAAPPPESTPQQRDVIPVAGFASAHAALVAAASLRMPDEMRRAGLVYHERALASRNLASKLRSTATLVLESLDDLAFAIDAKQAETARDILGSVRRWTSELTAECASAKSQNLESMRNLSDFAESLARNRRDPPPPGVDRRAVEELRLDAPSRSRDLLDSPNARRELPRLAAAAREDQGPRHPEDDAPLESAMDQSSSSPAAPMMTTTTTTTTLPGGVPATTTSGTTSGTAPTRSPFGGGLGGGPLSTAATDEMPLGARSATESLELASDDDVLELLLPVTADDLHRPTTPAATAVVPTGGATNYAVEPVIKCLGELHVVFSRMELFWSKVEVSLDTVLRRSEALETLLKFAETPKLKTRFDKRLDQFRQFWANLATWHLEIVGLGPKSGAVANAGAKKSHRGHSVGQP